MRIPLLFVFLLITAGCLGQAPDSSFIIDTGIYFIKPDRFYVSDVIDSREDKAINTFCIASGEDGNILRSCSSLRAAVKMIFEKKLRADSSLAPVIVDIKKFTVIPAVPEDKLEIELRFQSALNRRMEFAFYSSGIDVYKNMKSPEYFSGVLNSLLPDVIRRLNRIVNSLYKDFPFRGIKVINRIQPVAANNNADTFFYKASEQLSWKDFKGKPDNRSAASAVTVSSFLYNHSSVIEDGVKTISINTVCYFLKKNSWVKPGAASHYILEHERLHFTITCLWALKFSEAIDSMDFFMPLWQTQLAALDKEYFLKMSEMQANYDAESENGLNEEKQRAWKNKINSMLCESLPGKEGFLPGLMK